MKKLPDRTELETLYLIDNLSLVQIGARYGVSNVTARNWLLKLGIPLKSHSEMCRIANKKNNKIRKPDVHSLLKDKDWLYDKRVTQRLSKETIAEHANCSITLVNQYLKKHGIPDFKLNESEVSVQSKLANKDYLQELYKTTKMEDIAKVIGSSKATVSLAFKRLGIEPKDPNSWDRKFTRISKGHQEVINFIKSIYDGEIQINKSSIIGKELDIYVPDKKFAIEFNGLHYHTEYNGTKGKYYHSTKTKLCQEKGISLFHIFSDQWEKKRDIVQSMILSKLGLCQQKKYARKLELRKIEDHRFVKAFIEESHLQGHSRYSLAVGLFEGEQCYAVMTFATPRFSKKADLELIRYCNRLNYSVVGGFSKLLGAVQDKTIISYSDNTYSGGNVYEKNGFILVRENSPGYWYVDSSLKNRYPRTMFTKKQLKAKFGVTTNLSEHELMIALKFRKIWNCGTKTWIKFAHQRQ